MPTNSDPGGLIGGHKHGRVPRALRQEQLLDIAEALFTTQGYEYTSIEEVARQAGVTRPIIYGYYGSKEGLYVACVQRARAAYEAALSEVMATAPDAHTQLERGANLYFSMIEQDSKRWRLLFSSAAVPIIGELGTQLAILRFQTVRQIATHLRAHAPDVSEDTLEAAANAIVGISEQLGHWWLRRPELPKAQIVAYACQFILHGIGHHLQLPLTPPVPLG